MKKKIFFLIIFALILRLYFIFIYPQFPVLTDAGRYDSLGWNLASGNGFVDETGKAELTRGPGYPLFLAIIYKIFGHSYYHVRFFQAVFSIFTIILIFLIAKEIFGKETALLVLFFAGFYPPFLSYNGILYAETIFTFLIVLFTYLFLCAVKKDRWWVYIFLGVISGYAVLLRAEFILVFFSFLVLGIFYSMGDFKKYIYAILTVLLILAPWTIRNYKVSGRPIFVSSLFGSTLWISSYNGEWLEWHYQDPYYINLTKGLDEPEKDKLLLAEGIKNIKENPLQYLKFCFKRMGRFWIAGHSNTFYGLRDSLRNYLSAGAYGKAALKAIFLIFNTLLVIFGVYGILAAVRRLRDKRREISFLILPILVITILHFFLYATARYQVPIMPLMIIFAAFGLFFLQHKWMNAR